MSPAANGKSLACGEWQISNLRFQICNLRLIQSSDRYLKFEI